MNKVKFTRVFILAVCVAVLFATVALADTSAVQVTAAQNDQVRQGELPEEQRGIDDELLEKQREINAYLFEQHKDEIAKMGFTVTHTAPADGYVEIGITPYKEEYAEYLYGIFGRDMVKVVEGQQAQLYTTDAATTVQTQELSETNSYAVIIAVAGAIVVVAGAAFILHRRRVVNK